MRIRILALAALAALLAPLPTQAQENRSCLLIVTIGYAVPEDCGTGGSSSGGGEAWITLSGSLDLTSRGLSRTARVSCWVCEEGSCTDGSPYGPATQDFLLSADPLEPTMADWQVLFFASSNAQGGNTPLPSLQSYYCRMELVGGRQGLEHSLEIPPTMPSYFATVLQARAEEGSTLVTELQGTLPQPVTTGQPGRKGGEQAAGGAEDRLRGPGSRQPGPAGPGAAS